MEAGPSYDAPGPAGEEDDDEYEQETGEQVAADEAAVDGEKKPKRGGHGRRKIEIEYIKDKIRRHITFSKRKAGISKKAYELSRLTGAQVGAATPAARPPFRAPRHQTSIAADPAATMTRERTHCPPSYLWWWRCPARGDTWAHYRP